MTSRRKLIKSLVIGGSTAELTGILPSKWVTPIVETVALPAHALTTGPSGPSFNCGSASAIDLEPAPQPDGNLMDAIELTFDCVSCSMTVFDFDDSVGPKPDSLIVMEVDGPYGNGIGDWDTQSLGGVNWIISDFDGITGDNPINNQESRIYSLIATRSSGPCDGRSFRVELDVDLINEGVDGNGSTQLNVNASIFDI